MATAVLSKAWKHVWITCPSLKLDQKLYYKLKSRFLDFVDQTLARRSSSIRRLHLYVPDMKPETRAHLDWWVIHAFRNYQLDELTLDSHSYPHVLYDLPSNAFLSSPYYSLKRLSLTRVEFSSETMMECLPTNCPFIESLCFNNCTLPSIVKVSRLSKLAEFVIRYTKDLTKIEIYAPKLLLFECRGCERITISLEKCDKLQCVRISSSGDVNLDTDPGLFRNLESLELNCSLNFETKYFVISSNHLKSLCLGPGFTNYPSLVEFDVINLENFTYSGHSTSFGLNFSALKKASVHLDRYWRDVDVVDFLEKLHHCDTLEIQRHSCESFMRMIRSSVGQLSSGLLSNINHLVLNLEICSFERLLTIPSSVRQQNRGLLCNVKHLVLNFDLYNCWSIIESNMCISGSFDTLLWLFLHPKSVTLAIKQEMKVLKFKYKEDKNGRKNYVCCNNLPNPCWQHHLEQVWIENSIRADANGKKDLRRHNAKAFIDDEIKAFFENANKGTKIIVKIVNLT